MGAHLHPHTLIQVVINSQTKGTTPPSISHPPCLIPAPLPPQGDAKGWWSPRDPEPADGGSVASTCQVYLSQPTLTQGPSRTLIPSPWDQKMMLKLIFCRFGVIFKRRLLSWKEPRLATAARWRNMVPKPTTQTHQAVRQQAAARHGVVRHGTGPRGSRTQHTSVSHPSGFMHRFGFPDPSDHRL